MNNPFVTKGYAGADYFCDRVKETEDLVKLLTNENNMALISPRRLGKTDLIHHCFAQPSIQKNYYTFIIDVYATNSLADFVEVFGRAIFDTLKPLGRKVWEGFFNTIKSIQQQISILINLLMIVEKLVQILLYLKELNLMIDIRLMLYYIINLNISL